MPAAPPPRGIANSRLDLAPRIGYHNPLACPPLPSSRRAMFDGPEIVTLLEAMQVTHVVWLPDSAFGPWEPFLEASERIELVRICREGEAWPLAAGLQLGGARPLIMMQTTGLFESGDALRNILFDLKIPLFTLLGGRSWLNENSPDTARRYAEPILKAWGLDYRIMLSADDKSQFREHFEHCRQNQKPGAVILAEGRM